MRKLSLCALGALIVAELSSCRATDTACPAILVIRVQPQDTTISVGDQFTIAVTNASPCESSQAIHDTTWTTSDPAVAVVGRRTGTVIGVAPGTAVISPTPPDPLPVHVRVTVK